MMDDAGTKAHILVVEDSPTQAMKLQYILESDGYTVSLAPNGVAALDMIYVKRPDLVISDVMMPEMDGFELCRCIKSGDDFNGIPVIMLTALNNPDDVIKGLESGANNFLMKPCDDKYLLTRIGNVIANMRLRKSCGSSMEIETFFRGKKLILPADSSDRFQILDLLLSTYEDSVQKQSELEAANRELRSALESLEASRRDLINARDEAERANRAKSEFLANMSHEIRTPMNSVLGFSELLESLISDPRQKSYAKAISVSGKNLMAIINDILDLSKIEAGKMTLRYDPLDINQLCREIETLFMFRISDKGLKFNINIAPDVPGFVILDELRIRQILVNLVGNAIKFTDRGEVGLYVISRSNSAVADLVDIIFRVSDTGIGIPEESRNEIFAPFVQQDGQNTRKYGGTGLGLAICSRLVEMMNGTIELTSEPGKGSRFDVILNGIKCAEGNQMQEREMVENRSLQEGCTVSSLHEFEALHPSWADVSGSFLSASKISSIYISDMAEGEGGIKEIAGSSNGDKANRCGQFDSVGDPIFSCHDDIENTLEELEGELYERWKIVLHSQHISSMEQFAGAVRELGEKGSIARLTRFAEGLQLHIDSFDIQNIMKWLMEFPGLVESIRTGYEKNGVESLRNQSEPEK